MNISERVDTHTHVVAHDRSRFPLAPTGVGRGWWSEPERDVDALLHNIDRSGIGRALLVQAVGAYGYDNRYLLHAVGAAPERLAAVPAVDLDDVSEGLGAEEAIARLAGAPGVVGVRFFAVSPGSSWTSAPERAASAFEAARRANLVVVLTAFEHQLSELADLLLGPGPAVALDHCGFPDLRSGGLDRAAPILALRSAEHVYLKVSSHMLHEAARHGNAAEVVGQLVGEFGANRLMWGSDYPQTGADYPALLATAEAATRSLPSAARVDFFGANATRVFDLSGVG